MTFPPSPFTSKGVILVRGLCPLNDQLAASPWGGPAEKS